MKTPCLDCVDRQIYCHVTCKKYKLYKQSREEIKGFKRRINDIEGYSIDNIRKIAEYNRKH